MRTCMCIIASLTALVAAELSEAVTLAAPAAQTEFLRHLAQAPAVQAAQEHLVASRRAAGAAGRLPDPRFTVGYARTSTSQERWSMYDAMLEQPLPRWGERDAMRAKAAAEMSMSASEFQDSVGETAAEVAVMLAEADAARAKLAVVDAQIRRASALQAALITRVATGAAAITEHLGVKSRLATLTVERDTMLRMALDAEQDVRGRLGLTPTEPVPLFFAPDRAAVILDRVPGVLAAQAKTAAAAALFSEARASRFPETALGLRYEREQEPGEPMNTIGFQLSVSLPVWQGASSDLENAAHARHRAARREANGWQFRAHTLLSRAERAATVAETARTAAQANKARLDTEYDALISAAAVENGTNLFAVLAVLDRLSEAERMVIEAEVAARQAHASLWRLAPPDLSSVPAKRMQP